ncbi:DUF502 domain-containing protein [Hypericibacter sp.]|uniref:DUF502 domain-containing protein n=1 Tax=Hypericibacter sp. TaxID=2705401 RepID=UPI003D6CF3C4
MTNVSGSEPGSATPVRVSIFGGLMLRLRTYFFAGILITAPIGITVYLAWALIHWVDGAVIPLIPAHYNPETYLPFSMPGIGLLILLAGLTLIGALTASLVGRMVVRGSDRLLNRTPVVRGVYNALKQIFETVLSQKSQAFREVVLVEYPRKGVWALGFITGTPDGEIQDLGGGELASVFVPTTPNPTSGFLLFLPERELVRLSMTVEEGIKMVVSGGIVSPPDRRAPGAPKVQALAELRSFGGR